MNKLGAIPRGESRRTWEALMSHQSYKRQANSHHSSAVRGIAGLGLGPGAHYCTGSVAAVERVNDPDVPVTVMV